MAITQFIIPSYSDILSALINDYIQINSQNGRTIVVDPSTETYARLATFAQAVSTIYYLTDQSVEARMPDSASGDDLDRLANNRNVFRKGATQSQGYLQFVGASAQTIVASSQLTGPNSITYLVATTGVYEPGALIPVVSLQSGSNTNLEIGELVTWNNQPFNAQPTAPVATVITGGADAEQDNSLRARLIAIIQYQPQAGNSSQLISLSSNIDPVVQYAFLYSNYNGAGTLLVSLTGNQTAGYIGRDIPHLPLDNFNQFAILAGTFTLTNGSPDVVATQPQTLPAGASLIFSSQPGQVYQLFASVSDSTTLILFNDYNGTNSSSATATNPVVQPGLIINTTTGTPYNTYAYTDSTYSVLKNTGPNLSNDASAIYGQLPINVGNQYATAITTVNNIPTSISTALALPYPVGGPNNGFGGGWLNYTTWPNPDGYVVDNFCLVTSVTSSTIITVQAASLSVANAIGPTVGVTKINWINRSNAQNTGWLAVQATILQATDNGNNTWTLTLDTPLVFPTGYTDFYGVSFGVTVGDCIMPASTNVQNYLNGIQTSYSLLGPGEMTTSTGLLSIGAQRSPGGSQVWTEIIDPRFLKNLINSNQEVSDAEIVNNNAVFLCTVAGTTFTTHTGTSIVGVAPQASAPPNIYVPAQIAFYDLNQINYLNYLA
jgi:hypothetical protein